jgi:hypothetical protein
MGLPTLPPPPGGWTEPAPLPSTPRSPFEERPAWRQGRPGWAVLHLVIGIGVWFVGLFAMGIVLAAAGRTETDFDAIGNTDGGAFMLFLGGALIGWILFAYTEGSSARRWGIFACIAGGTWLIMLAVLLNATT